MSSGYDNLKLLMNEIKTASTAVQDACIHFGEAKARLQLEIYRLIKEENISNDEVTKVIDDIAVELEQEYTKQAIQPKTTTKFFREQINKTK